MLVSGLQMLTLLMKKQLCIIMVFLWWQQQHELSPYPELIMRNNGKQNLGFFSLS